MVEAVSPALSALNALWALGYKRLSVHDLARLHPPDAFEEELIVMADVRAYFQVSFKVRFSGYKMSGG